MHRRHFLILGSVSTLLPALPPSHSTSQKLAFSRVRETIFAVQKHMFPLHTPLPSAQEVNTIAFLEETIFHPSYDKDIRAFVIRGAHTLHQKEKGRFHTYTTAKKEQVLRRYEESEEGRMWLSRIMILSLEALLSAPVYGCNPAKAAWHALQRNGGIPEPTKKYIYG